MSRATRAGDAVIEDAAVEVRLLARCSEQIGRVEATPLLFDVLCEEPQLLADGFLLHVKPVRLACPTNLDRQRPEEDEPARGRRGQGLTTRGKDILNLG